MKKIFLILILALLSYNYSFANTLIERKIDWYKAKVIEFDTKSKVYDLKVWIDKKWWSSLREIMIENNWVSWVNWVFECPKDYPSCGWKNYTINERYVDWKKIATYDSTWDRVVFGWTKAYEAFLFQTWKINENKEWEIYEGFANHPLLLKDWEPQTEKYHELWLIDNKMKSKASKNFICSNKDSSKIYFGYIYDIDIDNFAVVLKTFGCYNAINLDAWASIAYIYNGKYIAWPWREILDWVFIVPKGIDVKSLEKTAKNIMNQILLKYKTLDNSSKINILNNLNSKLTSASNSIYSKNTIDIMENWKKVWTKTSINSTKTLSQLYVINVLRTYTDELAKKIAELEKLKNIKKLDLDVKVDVGL